MRVTRYALRSQSNGMVGSSTSHSFSMAWADFFGSCWLFQSENGRLWLSTKWPLVITHFVAPFGHLISLLSLNLFMR